MPWSIFTDGGGDGAALTWARDLLSRLGAPDNPSNEQFVYDWEKSEGGGGKFNPLNQGPVPGHPELTTTGSQYGGGAADYASWDAGLQGAVDYINMPNYTAVKAALMAGNGAQARSALIQSPWAASHYGNGSAFSNAAVPGQASALPGFTGSGSDTGPGGVTGASNITQASWTSNLGPFFGGLLSGLTGLPFADLSPLNIKDLIQRGALIVLGTILLVIGILRFTQLDKTVLSIASKGAVSTGGKKGEGSASQPERKENKTSDGG